jgi:hypothetical protein
METAVEIEENTNKASIKEYYKFMIEGWGHLGFMFMLI